MNTATAGSNEGDPETIVTELPNGVRVAAIPLPHLQTEIGRASCRERV